MLVLLARANVSLIDFSRKAALVLAGFNFCVIDIVQQVHITARLLVLQLAGERL